MLRGTDPSGLRGEAPTSPPLLAAAVLVAVELSSCLAAPLPAPYGDLPLEARNLRPEPVAVAVAVRETNNGSTLFESERHVPPNASRRMDPLGVPFGSYVIDARAGDLRREFPVRFTPHMAFVRVVVHPDVIAYQTG